VNRRDALRALGALGLTACDSGRPKSGVLGIMERWNRGAQRVLFGTSGELVGGELSPETMFPVYYASPHLPIAPPGWRLKIGGNVERPAELTLDQLMQLSRTDLRIEHHCVEGWSATADWHGVQLAEVARMVGARPGDYVEFRSFDDGYWSSWDRDSALHPQTLLAYGMNGHPLAPEHGAPVRLYGGLKLGYKQVKYLTEVNFVDHIDEATGGYWEAQGYEWYAGT